MVSTLAVGTYDIMVTIVVTEDGTKVGIGAVATPKIFKTFTILSYLMSEHL